MDVTTAWAAGLFEGEGCLAKDGRGSLGLIRALLASTDEDAVLRFHMCIGVGQITFRHYKRPLKDQWIWDAHGDEAVEAIEKMLPWLCSRHAEKAKELLDDRAALIAQATRERTCASCGTKFSMEFTSGWKKRTKCFSCSPSYMRRLDRETAMERVRGMSWA